MKPLSHIVLFLCIFSLVACQTVQQGVMNNVQDEQAFIPPQKPNTSDRFNIATHQGDYYPIAKQIQCVPHARNVSGIPIRGNAHTWWHQANGVYERRSTPKVGAVMVLSKTSRLKYGHLAVVKRVIDSRTIEVEHANWGGAMHERKIVYKNMPVIDSSEKNDWSRARFFNYPSRTYGSVYPVSGFIIPNAQG